MALLETIPNPVLIEQLRGLHTEYTPEVSETVSDRDFTIRAMGSLAVRAGSEIYYEAADPGYKSAFARDSLIAMSLRGDADVLESQIDYSAQRLGKVRNPRTGEEPGKGHHELPGYKINGQNTAYNACDTSAEFLRSLAALTEHQYDGILEKYISPIGEGVSYITRHVNQQGLFEEDPKFAGVKGENGHQRKFALKVTNWKDSELNREGSREPNYPIVYTLAHFQNAEALTRIGQALGNDRLAEYGHYMIAAGMQFLWNRDHFVSAIDGDGIIDPPSSDSLHTLLHILPEELPPGYAQKVQEYSKQLETEAGYRAGIPVTPDVDPYHMKVWTHEQALLNASARKHQLYEAETVTHRIEPFIIPKDNVFPEMINPDTLQPDGNIKQLWAMGAYLYFQNPDQAFL